jgi:hypothetical protein
MVGKQHSHPDSELNANGSTETTRRRRAVSRFGKARPFIADKQGDIRGKAR